MQIDRSPWSDFSGRGNTELSHLAGEGAVEVGPGPCPGGRDGIRLSGGSG